jgi:hypothetical protein
VKKVYEWLGGKKWIFAFSALIAMIVALFCRVNPLLFGEFTAGVVTIGKFYFDANTKVKRDHQEFEAAKIGCDMTGKGDKNTTITVDTKREEVK